MCTEEFIRMMFTVDLYGNRGLDSRSKAARLSIYWLDAACRLVIPLRQVTLAQLNKYHHQSGNAASGKLV